MGGWYTAVVVNLAHRLVTESVLFSPLKTGNGETWLQDFQRPPLSTAGKLKGFGRIDRFS